MKQLATSLILIACCSGCAATDTPQPAPKTEAAANRHAVCVGRMYAERAGRSRSAVNWALYDYCMTHPD